MRDLLVFLVFVLVGGIFISIGHLCWVLIATVLRLIFGHPPSRQWPTSCPVCAHTLTRGDVLCVECGWSEATELNRRRIAEKQVDELARSGLLVPADYQQVLVALRKPVSAVSDVSSAPTEAQPTERASVDQSSQDSADEVVIAQLASDDDDLMTDRRELATDNLETAMETSGGPAIELPMSETSTPITPSPLTPEQRARRFAEKRHIAMSVPPEPPAEPPVPPRRQRQALVAAFMEERNIRWGELVGGMLIVSCSIALVVSFWAQIAAQPVLQFGVFNGVTAALFALGLHAAHRWRLPTTSQGLLIIATLLVPLNFLAIVAFTTTGESPRALAIVGEVASFVVFGALLHLASGYLLPRWRWALMAGVMVQAIWIIVIGREILSVATLPALYVQGGACLLVYLAANLPILLSLRKADISEEQAHEVHKLLGITTFSVALPLGLLLFRIGDVLDQLHRLSPLIGFLGVPGLAVGVLLWRRSTFTWVRLTGTSMAVAGVSVLLSSHLFAWPEPIWLLSTSVMSFFVLTGIALWHRVPEAHLVAAPCAALAFVLLGHVALGDIAWTVERASETINIINSAATGRVLVGFVLLYALASWSWQTVERRTEALFFLIVTAVATAISLALVTVYGFGVMGDPESATWVYLVYAAGMLVVALWLPHKLLATIALGVALPTLVQGIVFRYGQVLPWTYRWEFALLCHATFTAIGAVVIRHFADATRRVLWKPFCGWASFSSFAVLAFVAVPAVSGAGVISSPYLYWLAAVWFVVAWVTTGAGLFAGGQAMLMVAVVRTVYARLASTEWYIASKRAWCDPWTLEYVGVAVVVLGLIWIVVRCGLRSLGIVRQPEQAERGDHGPAWRWTASRLLYPRWPALDHFAALAVVCLLSLLSVYGVVPGAAQELSPQTGSSANLDMSVEDGPPKARAARTVPAIGSFELPGLSHDHALGAGAWVLLAATLVLFLALIAEEYRDWKLCAAAVTVSTATLLLAGQWQSSVSVASALRWLTASFFAAGSIAIWGRRSLLTWCEHLGWRRPIGGMATFEGSFSLLVTLTVAPLVAMATCVSLAAVSKSPPTPEAMHTIWLLLIVFLASVAIGLSLRLVSERAVFAEEGDALDEKSKHTSGDVLSSLGFRQWANQAGTLLLVLGSAPLVVITLFVVGNALYRHPIVGPEPGSFFARIGLATSYAVPLLVIALSVVGHALRERSERLALAAGLLLNFCATAAYLLSRSGANELDALGWLQVAELNAIVSATYALLWMFVIGRGDLPSNLPTAPDNLLSTQVALGAAFATLSFLPPVAILFWLPDTSIALPDVAGAWGWSALVLVGLSLFCSHRKSGQPSQAGILGAGMAAIAILVALEAHRWDSGNWLAYHLLLTLFLVGSSAALVLRRLYPTETSIRWSSRWANILGMAALALSARALMGDPYAPWWSMAGFAGVSLLAASLACLDKRRRYLYLAAPLCNIAISLWWIERGPTLTGTIRGPGRWIDFLHINVSALALPAIAWMLIETRVISRHRASPHSWSAIPFHRLIIPVAMAIMGLSGGLMLLVNIAGAPVGASPVISCLAALSLVGAVVSCLWDQRARWVVASLYLLGLELVAITLSYVDVTSPQLAWTGTMVISAYALAGSYLWSRRRGLEQMALRIGVPTRDTASADSSTWLLPMNGLLVGVVVLLGYWAVLEFEEFAFRLAAAQAIIAQAFSVGLMARGRRRSVLQSSALWVGVFGAIAFGWSWLNPSKAMEFLNHTVVVSVALGGMATFYGVGLTKVLRRENEWTKAAEGTVPLLVAAAVIAIVVTLTGEVYFYTAQQNVPISGPAIAAVILMFVGLAAAGLVAAIIPGRDPLGLSERQRTIYVYAAEAMLALLFLHVRLTMPWLFSGFFTRYWTFIVMLIAYCGVGISELFRRQRRVVLAEPLEKTGTLLPMLPVVGYWVVPGDAHFSLLMLIVGLMYAAMSVLRRSFLFGVLAALCANGGIWYLLHRSEQMRFFEHPQLWLIPPALCVLVAAYLNRKQLSETHLTTIRYLCSTVIYTSSTADIFLNGVAQAPWLPFVLAGLSLAGVFAGILLRVRSFLFLGTSFLALALFTVIWFAAVDLRQTWLWYVSGIVMGILIIAIFALFEKNRKEMLELVDRLKHWDG